MTDLVCALEAPANRRSPRGEGCHRPLGECFTMLETTSGFQPRCVRPLPGQMPFLGCCGFSSQDRTTPGQAGGCRKAARLSIPSSPPSAPTHPRPSRHGSPAAARAEWSLLQVCARTRTGLCSAASWAQLLPPPRGVVVLNSNSCISSELSQPLGATLWPREAEPCHQLLGLSFGKPPRKHARAGREPLSRVPTVLKHSCCKSVGPGRGQPVRSRDW